MVVVRYAFTVYSRSSHRNNCLPDRGSVVRTATTRTRRPRDSHSPRANEISATCVVGLPSASRSTVVHDVVFAMPSRRSRIIRAFTTKSASSATID